MASYSSNLGYIGIGSQGNQKTTAVGPDMFIKFTAESIGPEWEHEVLKEIGNGKYDMTSVKTFHRENIGFTCYARPKVAGELYAALLGKDVPSHLTTTPFYHTITAKTTDLPTTPMQPWLTVEKCLVSSTISRVQRVRAVKLTEITLSGEAGQPVQMEVAGHGISCALRTTESTDTYETDGPYSFYHGTYMVNTPTTTNFVIKSFSVKLTAENNDANQTTELTRYDINNLKLTGEVTIGLLYQNYVMFQKANYGATTTPTATFSDGSLNLILSQGTGTANRRLQLTIPKVRLQPHSIALDPSPTTLEQPLSGIALKMATTNFVTVTCYNTIATTLPL